MIEESTAFLPIWMLLSAALGFTVGDMCSNSYRHRKCLEQANAELRDQLNQTRTINPALDRELKRQRSVINDIHKHVTAVTKALQKHPS